MKKITIAKVFSLHSSFPYFSSIPMVIERYGKELENRLKKMNYEVKIIEEPISYEQRFLQDKRYEIVGEKIKKEESLKEFLQLNSLNRYETLICVVNFLMRRKGSSTSFLILNESRTIFGCIYEDKFFSPDFYSKRVELGLKRLFSRVPTSSPESYLEEIRKVLKNYQELPSPPPSAGKVEWESEFTKTIQSLKSLLELAKYDLPADEFERLKGMTQDLLEGSKVFNPFIYELFKI
ncbi:MAG TPA: hypothetical protein ENF38_00155 [Candidatus Aenigmarchaeota archaeon]|nr:hypothetical protein [Candidatus Aenigmarchaeota archaeon]